MSIMAHEELVNIIKGA